MVAGDETFVQPDYSVRECDECGLLFRTPILSPDDLKRYYAKTDFRGWEIDGFYPTERCVLEILRQLPSRSMILDFGCSSGRLLAPLIATHECYGIELNIAAATEATKKGITLLPSLDALRDDSRRFDAIVLADVFEHLARPLDIIAQLVKYLKDGGLLLMVTGNGDARACRRSPALFWYFRTLEHLCMLTSKHAQFMRTRLDLRLERWIEMSHYDFSPRERTVQTLQNFMFWQFRSRTVLAQFVLRFLPGMRRLKSGRLAPTYSCSRDHVIAVFRKNPSVVIE
jgi:2-polyprenyl-3-methyl-5-hydroxy-6-metoxy-1,4-benzoquinol methylase